VKTEPHKTHDKSVFLVYTQSIYRSMPNSTKTKTPKKGLTRPRAKTRSGGRSFALGVTLGVLSTSFLLLFNLNNLNQSQLQIAQASGLEGEAYTYSETNPHPKVGKVDMVYNVDSQELETTVYYLSNSTCDEVDSINLSFIPSGVVELNVDLLDFVAVCTIDDKVMFESDIQEVVFVNETDFVDTVSRVRINVE
jgi:hypothetical protein